MITKQLIPTALLLVLAANLVTLPAPGANAQNATDEIETLRHTLRGDRKVLTAEAMEFTAAEGQAFWPLYGEYRAEMDKLGDGLVKLLLEYSDAYPNVPEDQAGKLLKSYVALEKDWVSVRAKYLKRFAAVLPASKVLRFTQVENRFDLALRLQMASAVPLTPIKGQLTGETGAAAVVAEGVPGGGVVATYELTATVAALDQASRKVTLVDAAGIKQTVKAGPEVINFAQIRVGDRLKITATEELVVYVAGAGETPANGGAQLVARAPKGAKPGALMAETTRVTAKAQIGG